jgi:cation:H+ antiporter
MLIKGADMFVDSSSSIAKKMGVSSIIIGLTIAAIGTSSPEAMVSISSSLKGMNDMCIANVIGSNLFNLLMVLGASSIMGKLKINNYKEIWLLLGVCVGLLLMATNGTLSMLEGIALLVVFTIYILSLIRQAKDNKEEKVEDEKKKNLLSTIVLGVIGLVSIVWGGNLVVDSASAIALQLGVSEMVIGLTVASIGTSLPEFVTSIVAIKKGELDIAINNIIGSNIFNVLLILGTASSIKPLVVSTVALFDIFFMTFTVIMFVCLTKKEKMLTKSKGLWMILVYIMYLIITIIR